MATRTWRGTTNSNWGTASNWAQGAVPLAADDVVFDASSPACTVNVAAVGLSIDFTNYTNTITITNNITISSNVTLGASMTFAGTGALFIAIPTGATGNLTSNGKSIPNLIFGNFGTYLLTDNWTVTNLLTLSSASIINGVGRILNVSGSLTLSASVNLLNQGTATINFNGTGTWNSTLGAVLRNNVTINTAGTLTINNISYNTGTLTYTAGSVICTGTFQFAGAGLTTTLDCAGITWNNFLINTNQTIITNDLYINGLLTLGLTSNVVTFVAISGTKTIYTNGGITTTLSSGNVSSSSVNIKVTSGTITPGVSSSNAGYIAVPLFEFAGNVTIASTGFLHLYGGVSGTGIVKYTSGIITTTGSNVLLTNNVVDTAGIIWSGIRLSQFAAGGSNTLTSDLTCTGLFNIGFGTITNTINGPGKIISSGGFAFTNGVTTGIVTGNTILRLTGGSVTGLSSGQLRLNMELAGNVTFTGGLFYNTGTITYVSGTITTVGSTITSNTVLTMNTNGMTWNNISFSAAGLGLTLQSNFQMSGTLTTSGTFTFLGAYDATIGNITTTINGSTITLVAGRTYNITGAITLTGSLASPIQLKSSVGGSVAYFNSVNNGTSTRDVGFVTATDINSSGGLTIYDYKGIFNGGTTNWSLLTEPRTLSYGYSV